jgi:hypothetical protein
MKLQYRPWLGLSLVAFAATYSLGGTRMETSRDVDVGDSQFFQRAQESSQSNLYHPARGHSVATAWATAAVDMTGRKYGSAKTGSLDDVPPPTMGGPENTCSGGATCFPNVCIPARP